MVLGMRTNLSRKARLVSGSHDFNRCEAFVRSGKTSGLPVSTYVIRECLQSVLTSLLAALIGEVGGNSTKDRFASVWTSRLCLRSGSSPILPDRYQIWR